MPQLDSVMETSMARLRSGASILLAGGWLNVDSDLLGRGSLGRLDTFGNGRHCGDRLRVDLLVCTKWHWPICR